jgi:glycosyltransferase involved in cell wall biosynthesis
MRLSGPVGNAMAFLESHKIPARLFGEPSEHWVLPEKKGGTSEQPVEECRNTYARGVKIWNTISYFSKDFAKYERCFRFVVRNLAKLRADYLIGYDPEGVVRAYFASRFLRVPYLAHSLEFAEEFPLNRIEREAFRNAQYVLAPGKHRLEILKRQYKLRDEQLLSIPNSDRGLFAPAKSDFLRQRLGIPANKKIILCLGTLTQDHCVDELISAARGWSDDVILVLHGWALSVEDREAATKVNSTNPGRIVISEGLVAFEDREKVFQSADLGVVAFSDQHFNTRHTADAAGKLFGFAKAGVPVAVKNTPGMAKILQANPIGFLVEKFCQADALAIRVCLEREAFLPHCQRFFQQNEFDLHFSGLMQRLGILSTDSE